MADQTPPWLRFFFSILPLLASGPALAGPDPCTLDADGYTCSGNQSDGVASGVDFPSASKVHVKNLNQDIAPPLGTAGINLGYATGSTESDVFLHYQVYVYDLNVIGAQVPGISVTSQTTTSAIRDLKVWAEGTVTATSGSAIHIDSITQNGSSGGAAVFGNGGVGHPGGDIGTGTVRGSGIVHTTGDGAPAVSVTLTAGDGGKGGNAGAFGSGGNGGAAGAGAAIRLNAIAEWQIVTEGTGSHGIQLASTGGRGGVGGTGDTEEGGTGQPGGVGGDITIGDDGPGALIITTGNQVGATEAAGIRAVSQGGNGGAGGDSNWDEGGKGGEGGEGGAITIGDIDATIRTDGPQSPAVYLVSQGGIGGDGGEGDVIASGGAGAGGGRGGAVSVKGNWNITTGVGKNPNGADASHGIAARSFGAPGGKGGNGTFFNPKDGSFGRAGDAGPVTVDIAGTIELRGTDSVGIAAQSIGGYGRSAGTDVGIVSFAATGGSAGAGGTVDVVNAATITALGDESAAIYAQSIGGGGGNGGDAFGLFYSQSGEGSIGGNGGAVTVTNAGALTVSGHNGYGILAQSTGGTGGTGGYDASVFGALGGRGADASHGGTVAVTNTGTIMTGNNTGTPAVVGSEPACAEGCSPGILALSIGGGGGIAHVTGAAVAVGGVAGGGGHGGLAQVENSGDITTYLANSIGIGAVSIGGSGGLAHGTGGIVSIGDHGGGGGHGDSAIVKQHGGNILTAGDDSHGVVAQSIGGGGGNGSSAISAAPQFALAIGGDGGGSGNGGSVTYEDGAYAYDIKTSGDRSHGIFLHSIGGSGGRGGYATAISPVGLADVAIALGGDGGGGGDGGAVSASVYGAIETGGAHSTGLFAHSLGGGGGSADNTVSHAASPELLSVSVSVGGRGGTAGHGGEVSVNAFGDIITTGAHSSALKALSHAGGGGDVGVTIAASAGGKHSTTIAVGGDGGGGGNAGLVEVVTAGNSFETRGTSSQGIFAQSVGGSGGNAGVTVSVTGITENAARVAVGGAGGAGGSGNVVSVTADTDVATAGEFGTGIHAQSIGGGGGNGNLTIAGGVGTEMDVSVSVGGPGGASGFGGAVAVTSSGDIRTTGHNAYGIFAQSTSQSGGSGGFAVSGNVVDTNGVEIALLGNGGSGGFGGPVGVDNEGNVSTNGDHSTAIFLQSLGSGGGSASGSIAANGFSTADVKVSIGGSGGSGGSAGAVSVGNTGRLQTNGVYASGVAAHSIGGAGGNGGFAATGGIAGGKYGADASFTLGGGGGTGGTGGAVTVRNEGAIYTADLGARGLYALSQGGSGGTGGSAFSGTLTLADSGNSYQVATTIGGGGGNGSTAGAVEITNSGDIDTLWYDSQAIKAQSVGGNGGSGGNSYALLASVSKSFSVNLAATVGGEGGSGSLGGPVTIENSGFLTTQRGGSAAIVGQSIGGDGGYGGNAGTVVLPINFGDNSVASFNVSTTIGGIAGTGAHAGPVTIDNDGAISTAGDASPGIYAQSSGGGGGYGGAASAATLAVNGRNPSGSSTLNVSATLAIGGDGGASGDGGDVMLTNRNSIHTAGIASYGIYAQSHGGGGGNGGDGAIGQVGDGGDGGGPIGAWTSSEIFTEITDSAGDIYNVYKVYKAGKNLLTSWNVAVGGDNGANGEGGSVTVNNTGTITTLNDSATAIYAISTGGGGGSGGDGLGGFLTKVTVGGGGSGGGDGGDIEITSSGSLLTSGAGAMGIYAQSVGGGGGTAGDVELAFSRALGGLNIGVGVATQGDGGAGGNGGAVNVTASDITTTGRMAHGIWAHSIAGAGGAAGFDNTFSELAFAGSSGDKGTAGTVTVVSAGDILLSGEGSVGIFAQSAGGGATGEGASLAGDVSITVAGAVNSTGENGRAILAQSEGGDGNGTVSILVEEGGLVSTAENGFDTITILNGKNNVLTNYGTIQKLGMSTATTNAVVAIGGVLAIDNHGLLAGPVVLDGNLVHTVTNASDGVLHTSREFYLGTRSTLFNHGRLMPGGPGEITTTALTGSLVQSETGTLVIDLDAENAVADRISANATADLAGEVSVNIVGLGPLQPAQNAVTIVSADFGVSAATQNNLKVESTAVATYGLSYPTGNDIVLGYTIDFAGAVSSPHFGDNQKGIARYLQDGFAAGADDGLYSYLASLAAIADADSYVEALHSLSPEVYADNQVTTIYSSQLFNDSLLSCAERDGQFRFVREGQCMWMGASGRHTARDAGGNSLGFDESAWALAGGVQFALDENWNVGGGFAYEKRVLDIDGLAHSDGDQFQGGLVAKRRYGNTVISAAVSGGFGTFDVERAIFDGSTASGQQDIAFAAGELRAAHTFERGDWYFKPQAGLGFGYVSSSDFSESGAGAADLRVDGSGQGYANVRVAMEAGGEFALRSGALARPKIAVGLTQFLTDSSPSVSASSASGSIGGAGFTVVGELDRTYLDVELGVEFLSAGNWVASANGFGRFSDNTRAFGGGVKLAIPF